jgi:hypothetical protein
MEQGLPRTPLNGSALVGLLAQLGLVDAQPAKPSFIEGMGRWLGWADAIPLSAALQTAPAAASSPAKPVRTARPAPTLDREFIRVQSSLRGLIEDDSQPALTEVDFPSYRRRYINLQQSMQASIAALRAQARTAVARLSPALSQLAAIDAVMDEALAEREQALLTLMPALLQKHFERLHQADQHASIAEPRLVGVPAQPASPNHPNIHDNVWLKAFRRDMKRLLLAELDLRLQATQGLLEAAAHHATEHP